MSPTSQIPENIKPNIPQWQEILVLNLHLKKTGVEVFQGRDVVSRGDESCDSQSSSLGSPMGLPTPHVAWHWGEPLHLCLQMLDLSWHFRGLKTIF